MLFTLNAYSQEPQFSQFNSFPLYLNPALTGVTPNDRTAVIYRVQWMGIPGAYRSYGFSYDKNWIKKKSGVGLLLMKDETSWGAFSTLTAGGLYSYHLQIDRTKSLSSGARVSYFQQKLVPEKVTFADQLIRNDGSPTYEVFDNRTHAFADISWGFHFSDYDSLTDKGYYAGISLDHLNSPPIAFNESKGSQPWKYSLQGGFSSRLTKDVKDKTTSAISFSFLYKAQRKWDQADFTANYTYRTFDVGLSYRGIPFFKRYKPDYPNRDAVIILAGYHNDYMQVNYSFDFTVSKLGISNTLGSHEVSVVNKFKIPQSKKSKYKKKLIMATPKF